MTKPTKAKTTSKVNSSFLPAGLTSKQYLALQRGRHCKICGTLRGAIMNGIKPTNKRKP